MIKNELKRLVLWDKKSLTQVLNIFVDLKWYFSVDLSWIIILINTTFLLKKDEKLWGTS